MRSFRRIAFVLAAAAAVSAVLLVLRPAHAASGDLDPTFGSGGRVDAPAGENLLATSVLVDSSSRILVGGNSRWFTLARYEPSGSVDPGFGSGGVAIGPPGNAKTMALQKDGKVLLAGNRFIDERGYRSYFSVVRFEPDGSIDRDFASDGSFTDVEGGVRDLALQPDGKIIAAGTAADAFAFGLVRLIPDGTPDPSFGLDGVVKTQHGSTAGARAVALQPDGKIVAAGVSVPGTAPPPPPPPPAPPPPPPPGPPPEPFRMTLARYTSNGSLDPSFGSGGIVDTARGFSATIEDMALQPDGKIVVVGGITDRIYREAHISLARYLPSGALDPAFGSDGIVKTDQADQSWGNSLTLQPDGKIIVAGMFGVARFRSDGTPDKTFGRQGVASSGTPELIALAVTVQPDGRIVTAGIRANGGSQGFALNRYYGASPSTIGAPGIVAFPRAAVIQGRVSDGRSGVRVQILRRGCYDLSTHAAATTTTHQGGVWRVRVQPGSRTDYQAKIAEQTTAQVQVGVRPKVSLSKLRDGRYRASVRAGRPLVGRRVVLQRYVRGAWRSVRSIVLRRAAKRGPGALSSASFSVGASRNPRLRILYVREYPGSCYESAASRALRG